MRGAQKTITRELNSGAATAGRDAGKTSGSEWGKAFKTASAPGASAKSFTDSWNKIASTQAVAGGKTFGDAFTGAIGKTALGRGLLDGVRSSMRGVEAEGAQGGKTLGDVFSGAAVASVLGIAAGIPMFIAGQSLWSFLTALGTSVVVTLIWSAIARTDFDFNRLVTEITDLD